MIRSPAKSRLQAKIGCPTQLSLAAQYKIELFHGRS